MELYTFNVISQSHPPTPYPLHKMCTCDEIDLCCYFKDPDYSPSNQNVCIEDPLEQPLDGQKIESSLINITPLILKFPYNNPKCHSQRLTLWNRTIESLTKREIRFHQPTTFVRSCCQNHLNKMYSR